MTPITNDQLARSLDDLKALFRAELGSLKNEVSRLATHVDKQNGRVTRSEARLDALERAKIRTDAIADDLRDRQAAGWSRKQLWGLGVGTVAALLAAAGGLIEIVHHV